ncbi:MAG: hypothetical protein M3N29_00295 [Chloroflexota bacterium]|nr:hypothetical protein [Chloroflexota bacterium]
MAQEPFEDLLTDWLDSQPTSAPDVLADSVLLDLESAGQRRHWVKTISRSIVGNAARLALAATAALVVLTVILSLFVSNCIE